MPSEIRAEGRSLGNGLLGSGAAGPLTNIDRKQLYADLAIAMTGAAAIGLFAISPVLLEHFEIAYLTPGGSPFSKFHPSTFCALAALVLRCLPTNAPLRTGWRIVSQDPNVAILAAAVGIAGVFSIFVSKTPVTPLVDTFLLPPLLLLLLRDLHPTIARRLALLLAVLLCVNAVMGLYEFLSGTHLVTLPVSGNISADPTRGDAVFDWRVEIMLDWRATALLGHPLINGLIVGAFILCLLAPGSRWLSPALKGPLILLQTASMFAFGARASIVLTLAFGIFLVLGHLTHIASHAKRFASRDIAIMLLLAVLLVGVGIAIYDAGFFDRTIERFATDAGSAKSRELMFQMFQPLTWSEIILGPSPEVVATWQRLYGLEFGIESSWIGLILTYGLLVAAFLMVGLFTFSRSIVQSCGRGAIPLLLFYFISVSGTTGLSGKTTSLAMIVVLAVLFLQKDERQVPLRATLA